MKKLGVTSIFVLLFFTSINTIFLKSKIYENHSAILAAFQYSYSIPLQTKISMRSKFKNQNITREDMIVCGKNFFKELKINHYDIKEIDIEETKRIIFTKDSKDAIVKVTISSIQNTEKEAHIIAEVILHNNSNNIENIKENLKRSFRKNNMNPTSDLLLIGTYNKKLEKKEMEEVINRIFYDLNGKKKERYEDEYQLGSTGFSKSLNHYIYSGKEKINFDVRLRYNSYEEKTYLYLATPIIEIQS